MWKLKTGQPPFEVVDGHLAGHTFVPGVEYSEIPEKEKARFGKVKTTRKKTPVKGEDNA